MVELVDENVFELSKIYAQVFERATNAFALDLGAAPDTIAKVTVDAKAMEAMGDALVSAIIRITKDYPERYKILSFTKVVREMEDSFAVGTKYAHNRTQGVRDGDKG